MLRTVEAKTSRLHKKKGWRSNNETTWNKDTKKLPKGEQAEKLYLNLERKHVSRLQSKNRRKSAKKRPKTSAQKRIMKGMKRIASKKKKEERKKKKRCLVNGSIYISLILVFFTEKKEEEGKLGIWRRVAQ